jgi:serine protease Do
MRRLPLALLVFAAVPIAAAAPALAAPPGLPPLPGGAAAGPGPNGGKADKPAPKGALALTGSADDAQARRGVVQVEQAGRPIAIGTVLAKDGRVITALSGLGAATEADLRYADGTVVKAKIGHKDKGWDLALLIPQTGRWLDGLVPTDTDPSTVELKAFLPAKTGKLGETVVGYKGRLDAKSKEGDALVAVLDLDLKGSPAVPGAPLVDPGGRVVGVLVHACKDTHDDSDKGDKGDKGGKPGAKAGAASCAPITVAAPVYALRGFLMKTPATAVMPSPWLGLGGASSDTGNVRGVRVVGLAPGSPAEKAGLKAGDAPDTIVAVDGQPVETPEHLAEVIAKNAIGHTVKLLVYSGGKFREVPVTLRAAPTP